MGRPVHKHLGQHLSLVVFSVTSGEQERDLLPVLLDVQDQIK